MLIIIQGVRESRGEEGLGLGVLISLVQRNILYREGAYARGHLIEDEALI